MPLPSDRWTQPYYSARLISVGQFRTADGLVLLGGGALGPQMSRRSAAIVERGPAGAACPHGRLAFEFQARLGNRHPSRAGLLHWRRSAIDRRRRSYLAGYSARPANHALAGHRPKIVAIWNARQAGGRALWFYPTIGAAIAAGLPWLTFSCPGCGQFGSVDLRTLDRHRGGAISGLIPSLSCRRCSPNAPFAKLEMLTAERP